MSQRVSAPWWAKAAAKIVLARIPLGYSVWSRLGVFRHGPNDEASYAFHVFKNHFQRAAPSPGFVTLEMGPGDALASAVLTRAFGGARSIQVDVGSFANTDLSVYRELTDYCRKEGLDPPNISDVQDFEEMLRRTNAQYMCNGLSSLREIETASVDFIYSQSCLEHIRLSEFEETLRETRRILKPNGAASHWVDLKDHLSYSLNNLRFAEGVWESHFMASSGFYTNRIRYSEMMEMFRRAGFTASAQAVSRWDRVPLPRRSLSPKFRDLPEHELTVKGFAVVCR